MIKYSKCMSCQKYKVLDNAPWSACEVYPNGIPLEMCKITIESKEPLKCEKYEFNPNWED